MRFWGIAAPVGPFFSARSSRPSAGLVPVCASRGHLCRPVSLSPPPGVRICCFVVNFYVPLACNSITTCTVISFSHGSPSTCKTHVPPVTYWLKKIGRPLGFLQGAGFVDLWSAFPFVAFSLPHLRQLASVRSFGNPGVGFPSLSFRLAVSLGILHISFASCPSIVFPGLFPIYPAA